MSIAPPPAPGTRHAVSSGHVPASSLRGPGCLAAKTGLQYAPPFTFLAPRLTLGLLLILLPAWWQRRDALRRPQDRRAGLRPIVAARPLATAFVAAARPGERRRRLQGIGVPPGVAAACAGAASVAWRPRPPAGASA